MPWPSTRAPRALLVALSGLGVGPGDEVIVPGYTFIASMSSIIYARAIPILAEVDRTLNLDPEDVRRKITPRTKAILVVHMLGNPARLDELKAIADEHGSAARRGLRPGVRRQLQGACGWLHRQAGTYSFNIFKTITAGDGGMVVTDDEAAYRRFFAFHDQGHSPLRTGVEVGRRPFVGLDFRMTELTAAVLLAQLRKLDTILASPAGQQEALQGRPSPSCPGLEFREITDPEGECATLLTVFLPTEEIARRVAKDLGTKVVADSGWHVYSQHGTDPGETHHHPRGLSLHLPLLQGRRSEVLEGACCRRPTRCLDGPSTSASASPIPAWARLSA